MSENKSIEAFNNLLHKEVSSEFEKIADSSILEDFNWDTILDEVEGLRALWKLGKGIEQRIYLRNLAILLLKQKGVTNKQKMNWQERLASDKKCKRLVENLLVLMHRLHDPYKTKIIANLFRAFLTEELELNNLLRLISIVENCYHDDLAYFEFAYVKFEDNKYSMEERMKLLFESDFYIQNLLIHGLFEEKQRNIDPGAGMGMRDTTTPKDVVNILKRSEKEKRKDLNKLGYLLKKYGFE